MVKGLDIFYDYFSEFTDQYVMIGGAACALSFYNTVVLRVLWEAMQFGEIYKQEKCTE